MAEGQQLSPVCGIQSTGNSLDRSPFPDANCCLRSGAKDFSVDDREFGQDVVRNDGIKHHSLSILFLDPALGDSIAIPFFFITSTANLWDCKPAPLKFKL